MAIIVEEERKTVGGIANIVIGSLLVFGLLLGIYYIFFKRPELVEQATPANFPNLTKIPELQEISADQVLNSEIFKKLQPQVEPLKPQTSGRQNPFLATF